MAHSLEAAKVSILDMDDWDEMTLPIMFSEVRLRGADRYFMEEEEENWELDDNMDRLRNNPNENITVRDLADPIPIMTPFPELELEAGSEYDVSVAFIISPNNFFVHLASYAQQIIELIEVITTTYSGLKSYAGNIPIGGSVMARYPDDGLLYRATVLMAHPHSKYTVQYVDYGNKQLIDVSDIWPLDRSLINLPKMAFHCSLIGIKQKGDWKCNPEIDQCFNAPVYRCIVVDSLQMPYKVILWNNKEELKDILIQRGFAEIAPPSMNNVIEIKALVGQTIVCRVSHIESFEQFFINTDLETSSLIEKGLSKLYMNSLPPLLKDDCINDAMCVMRYQNKVCRAILQDVSNINEIRTLLPDYGIKTTTNLANLMAIPEFLRDYDHQAVECRFKNYRANSRKLMTLDDMQAIMVDYMFIIHIHDLKRNRLVSTLYDKITGYKVAIFEPDDARKQVSPICNIAVLNSNIDLSHISHSESLNEIYLQKSCDRDKLVKMMDMMVYFYEMEKREPLSTYAVGGMCAVKGSDEYWYRSTIIGINGDEVKVKYCDYGNTVTSPKGSLKKLDPTFYDDSFYCIKVSTGLLPVKRNALLTLLEWLNTDEITAKLTFTTEGWVIRFYSETGEDLCTKLITENFAQPTDLYYEARREVEEDEADESETDSSEDEDDAIDGRRNNCLII